MIYFIAFLWVFAVCIYVVIYGVRCSVFRQIAVWFLATMNRNNETRIDKQSPIHTYFFVRTEKQWYFFELWIQANVKITEKKFFFFFFIQNMEYICCYRLKISKFIPILASIPFYMHCENCSSDAQHCSPDAVEEM